MALARGIKQPHPLLGRTIAIGRARGIKRPHPLGSVRSRSGVAQLTAESGVVTPTVGVKISALPAASAANDTDQFEVNQGGTSRRITVDQLFAGGTAADWDDITGKPATFPPTVPIAYTDISGTPTIPTTLPPNGAAGGALTGTYPNPTLVGGPLSNYLTTTAAGTTYLPLAGGTLVGSLTGTAAAFSGNVTMPTQAAGTSNTTGATTAFVAAALTSLSIKTTWFSANGTYTPDAKMIYGFARMRGGGGGSDSRTGSAGWAIGVGGGGEGGYAEKWFLRAAVLPTVAVTIGAGGVTAAAGGTTSFGALANATGGGYGTSAYAGSGGSGTGDLVQVGQPGGMGMAINGTAYGVGGHGGGGQRGAAALTTTGDLQDGIDGTANTGGGASGCAINNSTGSRTGRAGGSGWLQIIEFLTP